MSLELIYTSAPRGLSSAASGFCTVAATGGMSRQVLAALEGLSGYQFHFNLSDANADLNPVNFAHTRVKIGSETRSVLSRIAFAGADYSGRTNKIAHHVLLERGEQMANGPAWMMMAMARNVFVAEWEAEPRHLDKRSVTAALSSEPRAAGPATTWEAATGDAAWGGALVQAFRTSLKVPSYVVYEPGQDLLPLFEESLAILPPEQRWQVAFATYYTTLPAGCHYHWRGVLAGSRAAQEMRRFPNATVIDLTSSLGPAPEGPFAEAARTGGVLPSREPARPSKAKVRIKGRRQPKRPATPVATTVAEESEQFAREETAPGQDFAPLPQSGPPEPPRRRSAAVPVLVGSVVVLGIITAVLVGLLVDAKIDSHRLEQRLASLSQETQTEQATAEAQPAEPPEQPDESKEEEAEPQPQPGAQPGAEPQAQPGPEAKPGPEPKPEPEPEHQPKPGPQSEPQTGPGSVPEPPPDRIPIKASLLAFTPTENGRRVQQPQPNEKNAWAFDIGQGKTHSKITFFNLPQRIRKGPKDESLWSVKYNQDVGAMELLFCHPNAGDKAVLTCHAISKGGVQQLVCQDKNNRAATAPFSDFQWITLQLQVGQGPACQCLFREVRRDYYELHIGYRRESGEKQEFRPLELKQPYPWPHTLTLVNGNSSWNLMDEKGERTQGLLYGELRKLTTTHPVEPALPSVISQDDGPERLNFDVCIEKQQKGGRPTCSYIVRFMPNEKCLSAIYKRIEAWLNKEYLKWKEVKDGKAQGEGSKKKERRKSPSDIIQGADESLGEISKWFEQHGQVDVIDAWGIPVYSFRIRFGVPKAKSWFTKLNASEEKKKKQE